MTTARTTTAQPIAASISIPDAILHSTAFARRKPLLLLKIVRQTSPRSVQLPQTARRRSGKRHRPPRKVRKARVGGLRPHLFVCSEKMARQKGRPDRAGVRRCRKETGRLAGSASAPQRLCTCAGTGTALRRPFFCPLRRFPRRRARRGTRRRPVGPDRLPAQQSASFRAWHFQLRRRTLPHSGRPLSGPAFLRHASHSLPHSASPAAPDISLRARLYFAECRVFRNAAQLPPSASPWPHTRFPSAHVRASPSLTLLRIAAQSLTAVLDVFSCARRGRPFPPCPTTPRRLRTPDSSALRLFSAARPFTPELV